MHQRHGLGVTFEQLNVNNRYTTRACYLTTYCKSLLADLCYLLFHVNLSHVFNDKLAYLRSCTATVTNTTNLNHLH